MFLVYWENKDYNYNIMIEAYRKKGFKKTKGCLHSLNYMLEYSKNAGLNSSRAPSTMSSSKHHYQVFHIFWSVLVSSSLVIWQVRWKLKTACPPSHFLLAFFSLKNFPSEFNLADIRFCSDSWYFLAWWKVTSIQPFNWVCNLHVTELWIY